MRRVQGKATFRGHPVHLMLIPFPVAFWTGALFTDVAGAFSHDGFYFRMSVVLVMMGTIGAVLASVAGYVDYRTAPMSAKARGVATGHMWWSLAALAVFAIAWFARAAIFASPAGIAATVAGAVLLFVAGYLGSELANRYRIGIGEDDRAKRRR
ncbi:MAG: DUF2231 domain-containing protein [Candidatus Eremiobacteraeota bacterium]|nr:DUF2231 domain-containing protein [Candidatus Eremiobacteraeota bacterium]